MKIPALGLLLLLALGACAGCAHEPFAPEPMPKLQNPDPAAVRADFERRLPDRFLSDDTVVIHSPFQDLAVLAVLRVDRAKQSFELLGLSPVGVQLFLLAGEGRHTEVRFAIGPLREKQEVLESIARDVRRMYFDLTPAPGTPGQVHSRYVSFADRQAEETVEYQFGGPGLVLLQKRCPSWVGSVWKARYFQYTATPEGLFPHGIVLDNYRYFYRIVVKNRAWQVQ